MTVHEFNKINASVWHSHIFCTDPPVKQGNGLESYVNTEGAWAVNNYKYTTSHNKVD